MSFSDEKSADHGLRTTFVAAPELDLLQECLDALRARLSAPSGAHGTLLTKEPVNTGLMAREILRARRLRERIFGGELFADPAWDMLLELHAGHELDRRISVSSLCYASAVPPTTALRWVERLERDGWVRRSPDPGDRRRYWITLTEKGLTATRTYLRGLPFRL